MKASDSLPERSSSLVRVQLKTPTGHTMLVVGLSSLVGAKRLAQDLVAEGAVTTAAVQHRNKGVWKPAWSFVAALVLAIAVALSGCATHRVRPDDRQAALVEEALAAYRQAAEAIQPFNCQTKRRTIWGTRRTCAMPRIRLVDHTPHGGGAELIGSAGNVIYVEAGFFEPNWPAWARDALMSHEFSRFALAHNWPGQCPVRSTCEFAANAFGVRILVEGYGYTPLDAVRAMYGKIRLGAQQALGGATRLPGHEDPCAEVDDFVARFQLPARLACAADGTLPELTSRGSGQ